MLHNFLLYILQAYAFDDKTIFTGKIFEKIFEVCMNVMKLISIFNFFDERKTAMK